MYSRRLVDVVARQQDQVRRQGVGRRDHLADPPQAHERPVVQVGELGDDEPVERSRQARAPETTGG